MQQQDIETKCNMVLGALTRGPMTGLQLRQTTGQVITLAVRTLFDRGLIEARNFGNARTEKPISVTVFSLTERGTRHVRDCYIPGMAH